MSAIDSPGLEMLGLAPLLSMPWPHSWSKMAAISPVLRQPPPLRKKFTVLPFQNALQVSVDVHVGRELASAARCWPAGSRGPAR